MKLIKYTLFTIGFFLAFGEPFIMPILALVCWWICYILDDGTMFYKEENK
jgi:hypothetical protein